MSPAATSIIRDARLEDAPAILDVLQAAYPRWPAVEVEVPAIEHLRWKMAPPGDIPLHHSVVLVGGRIAAAQLRWVNRIQVGAGDYIGEDGADLAVHPDFRGQGLSRLIRDRDHVRLVAGKVAGFGMLSNAPQVRHMNEPDMISRPLTTWTRPFRLRSYASVHYRAGGLRQLLGAVWQRFRTRNHRRSEPAGRVVMLNGFDERTDAVWEAARRAYDIIAFRDATYLNWRFAPALSGETVVLGLLDGSRLLAYAVVRRAGDRGDLMDWLWRPDAEHAVPALLGAATTHLRASGARNVTCWLPPGHRAESALRAAGFANVGTQHILFGSREGAEAPPRGARNLRRPRPHPACHDERLRLRLDSPRLSLRGTAGRGKATRVAGFSWGIEAWVASLGKVLDSGVTTPSDRWRRGAP